ncbi:MAG: hypothetical protein LBQ79_01550 [Deltaproteobacteria bacterium]|jgi:hypothetical protein|nr:hypothetical protein [Deltaproteobacteria bacterium]
MNEKDSRLKSLPPAAKLPPAAELLPEPDAEKSLSSSFEPEKSITLTAYLSQECEEYKSQIKSLMTAAKKQYEKLNSMIQEKDAAILDAITNKDAEIRDIIENKNAEIRIMSEETKTLSNEKARVESEHNKLRRICFGVAIITGIATVCTGSELTLLSGFQPLKLIGAVLTAGACFWSAWLSYGRGVKAEDKAVPTNRRSAPSPDPVE